MATDLDPVVGNWYEHLDKGQKFEVVAIDEDNGLVEIQYFDGDLDEIDIDSWYEQDLEASEAPENWSGPMDDFEQDDLGYTETEMGSGDWQAPTGSRRGGEETETGEEETGEWGEETPPEEQEGYEED